MLFLYATGRSILGASLPLHIWPCVDADQYMTVLIMVAQKNQNKWDWSLA